MAVTTPVTFHNDPTKMQIINTVVLTISSWKKISALPFAAIAFTMIADNG